MVPSSNRTGRKPLKLVMPGSSPAGITTTSEEVSTVPFPPRGENCTMLASSTYDGYSVSFGEGYEFHGWITYTWVIPIKGRPTKGR